MPFILITLGKSVSSAVKQHIGRQATDLIVDLLGKRREVTAVLVEVAHAGAWCIGGEPQADAATPTHCEIAITAGTNSAVSVRRAHLPLSLRGVGFLDRQQFVDAAVGPGR